MLLHRSIAVNLKYVDQGRKSLSHSMPSSNALPLQSHAEEAFRERCGAVEQLGHYPGREAGLERFRAVAMASGQNEAWPGSVLLCMISTWNNTKRVRTDSMELEHLE